MATRRYLQLDVFAARAGTGNPLGVVLDAEGMDTASILFFNQAGSAMFKIFLGRDEHRQLLADQVSAFHALSSSLKEHA